MMDEKTVQALKYAKEHLEQAKENLNAVHSLLTDRSERACMAGKVYTIGHMVFFIKHCIEVGEIDF